MLQKPKELAKGSIPWAREMSVHIHRIHLDPLVVVMVEAEDNIYLLFPT